MNEIMRLDDGFCRLDDFAASPDQVILRSDGEFVPARG